MVSQVLYERRALFPIEDVRLLPSLSAGARQDLDSDQFPTNIRAACRPANASFFALRNPAMLYGL